MWNILFGNPATEVRMRRVKYPEQFLLYMDADQKRRLQSAIPKTQVSAFIRQAIDKELARLLA